MASKGRQILTYTFTYPVSVKISGRIRKLHMPKQK